MREIKFRVYDKKQKKMLHYDTDVVPNMTLNGVLIETRIDNNYFEDNVSIDYALMQFTGLKDKNGLKDLYEGDIIDETGNLKGNIYETHKGETDFVIQGLGTKDWCATYKEAMDRGCQDAQ